MLCFHNGNFTNQSHSGRVRNECFVVLCAFYTRSEHALICIPITRRNTLVNCSYFSASRFCENAVFPCALSTQMDRECRAVIVEHCTRKLLQICSQVVDKLCSHCMFPVVVTSLEKAVDNL